MAIREMCLVSNHAYSQYSENVRKKTSALNSLGPKFISLGHFQSIEHLNIP